MSGSDFWSRRRAAVEAEQVSLEQRAQEEVDRDRQAELEKKSDREILDELGLPEPTALETRDEFQLFLKSAVPDRLKRVALRRLWRTNPILANLDGLIEYGEDYTDAATVVENLTTTYQVGKGMAAHVQEMLRQAEASKAEEKADPDALGEAVEDETPDAEPVLENEATVNVATTSRAEEGCDDPESDRGEQTNVYATPRRMRYRILDGNGGAA